MRANRDISPLDRLLIRVDQSLRLATGLSPAAQRPYPAAHLDDAELDTHERRHVAGLMRVNHAGEVCAQAL